MNDETKAELMQRSREWLQSCVNAATRSGVPEEADLEAFILAHLDGEAARLAAAREEAIMAWRAGAADRDELRADCERRIAAAREEQREACALDAEERVGCASTYDEIRSVPLTATPLADRIAELERQREGMLMGGVTTEARQQMERAEKAEAERDALRADVEKLQALHDGHQASLEHLMGRALQAHDENKALRAQVEAARALCADFHRGGGLMWPHEVIAAMDGAKPK